MYKESAPKRNSNHISKNKKRFFSYDPVLEKYTEGKKDYSAFPKKKFNLYLTEHKNILIKEEDNDFYYFLNRRFSNYIDQFKGISQDKFKNFSEAKLLCSRLPVLHSLTCSLPEVLNAAIPLLLKNKLPFEQTCVFHYQQKKKESEEKSKD